jgi:tetratricopeptide (TPR) repeat protein
MLEPEKLQYDIYALLDKRCYPEALELVEKKRSEFLNSDKDLTLLAEIAGSYITIGSESYNLESVNQGIQIFEDNIETFKEVITEESIFYCLGNGYQAIYNIENFKVKRSYPSPENVKETLFNAKQYFLRAFKKLDLKNLDSLSIQILTNLGNNLTLSGRIVDALQLFDLVLKYNPNFPQALVSKADTLRNLIRTTDFPITISLFVEIFHLYKKASEQNNKSLNIKAAIKNGIQFSSDFLKQNNFDFNSMENELKLNEIEYANHNNKLKFYLNNFLSLSEHALYCKCNGSKIDNLTIGYSGYTTTDIKITQSEILLNRIKSEFSLGRTLYYEFLNYEFEDNVYYENLIDGITNGLNYEKLRTSFRLCFGILDKIAEGICFLFDLKDSPNENIYFESFWNPRKNKERWIKINSVKNIHLTALYNIACDLNKINGEFGFYKDWRNQMEHGIFTLTESKENDKVLKEKLLSEHTTKENFENQTKFLLQLTRSAIFSFVFCTREKLITND